MTEAQTAFRNTKDEIDIMLNRIQSLSDNHFDTAPDDVNWADVGSLGYVASQLKEITNFLFGEEK